MKHLKLLFIFPAIALIIFFYKTNFAASNGYPGALDTDVLADIENAIIIKGIEAGSDIPWFDSDTDNPEGAIIYDDSFNGIKWKKNISKNESIIKNLQKQDDKWHLTLHKIKKGENLWTLAKKYDTDYKLIIKANEIKNPDRLNHGRTILIPNTMGIEHKIVKYDTLGSLSKRYKVKIEIITAHNNIKNNLIKEGKYLFIPDAVEYEEKVTKHSSTRTSVTYSNKKLNSNNSYSKISDHQENSQNYNYKDKSKPEFIWPLKGEITSAFGKRRNPINNKLKFHCGIDIRADIGTPVKASADGEAIFCGWKKGYGRVVILKHKDGLISVYAHNKENLISAGERVQKGEIIASSGMSGAVTGPHLHFEIRKFVTPLNPYRFLK
ncbi:MAG: M23 family metallopeptidase [Spirochaetes bacterium]|nr:M23 family metallopeptidase [Spirochaetota bacterium]